MHAIIESGKESCCEIMAFPHLQTSDVVQISSLKSNLIGILIASTWNYSTIDYMPFRIATVHNNMWCILVKEMLFLLGKPLYTNLLKSSYNHACIFSSINILSHIILESLL